MAKKDNSKEKQKKILVVNANNEIMKKPQIKMKTKLKEKGREIK